MLIRRPTSQLNSDDLPTFGRPTIATRGSDTREPQEKTNGHKKAQEAQKKTEDTEQRSEIRRQKSF
jgi:hypothetical protein